MLKFSRPEPSVHPHHLSLLLFGKHTLFVVSAFNLSSSSFFSFLKKYFIFCVSPVPFSVTALYSRFFVGYFCPAQGVCNLVCFQQTAYNFMLFPLVKLSYKPPICFLSPLWDTATNNCHITALFGKTLLCATILQKHQHSCCRAACGVLFQEGKRWYIKFQQVLGPSEIISSRFFWSCPSLWVLSLFSWLLRIPCQKSPFLMASCVCTGWAAALTITSIISFICILVPPLSILFSHLIPLLRESFFMTLGSARCLFLTPKHYDSKVLVMGRWPQAIESCTSDLFYSYIYYNLCLLELKFTQEKSEKAHSSDIFSLLCIECIKERAIIRFTANASLAKILPTGIGWSFYGVYIILLILRVRYRLGKKMF